MGKIKQKISPERLERRKQNLSTWLAVILRGISGVGRRKQEFFTKPKGFDPSKHGLNPKKPIKVA